MIKYEAGVQGYRSNPVLKHEVERETDSFVWINGIRSAVSSKYSHFFNTWEEAHTFLIAKAKDEYDTAKRRLDEAAANLNKITELTNPYET